MINAQQGELDYALTQASIAALNTNSEQLLVSRSNTPPVFAPRIRNTFDQVVHILLHATVLALCVFTLVALWNRTSRIAFIVFLVWTVLFYLVLFALAWYGRPRASLLSTIVYRLRGTTPTVTPAAEDYPQPSSPVTSFPYMHRPQYHTARSADSHPRRDEESDGSDDGQQRFEDELARREVSILTVPRRKLTIVNPS